MSDPTFFEELEAVEQELAQRERARTKAWRWLTLRIPVIAALLYFTATYEQLAAGVGLVFVAAVADYAIARRKERLLERDRDELLLELEAWSAAQEDALPPPD